MRISKTYLLPKPKEFFLNFKVIEVIQEGVSTTQRTYRYTYPEGVFDYISKIYIYIHFANLKIYVHLQYERIQSQDEWLVNLIL